MAEAPIFLAGIDRSGIGLLGELLESHPALAITRRINFWDFYADRFGDLADPVQLERCLTSMMRYTRIRLLQPDIERLRADLRGGEATYARLFRLLQEQNMQRLGKERWGDKSLGAEKHAERILALFPDAYMIHVVRDPRDRYASRATHRSAGKGGAGSGAAAWLWSVRLARAHGHRYPGRYLSLRYEDLVSRPEASLRSICEFVHLDFSPRMLDVTDRGAEPLHTRSIGRFGRDLTPGEIRFIEQVTGAEMDRWGYEPSGPEWTPREKARFAVTGLPVALAGLMLWRPWTGLTGLLGRRPSDRRTAT